MLEIVNSYLYIIIPSAIYLVILGIANLKKSETE